jgi:hypothetical protein
LNPPHPRDDDGNKVDPEQVIINVETNNEGDGINKVDSSNNQLLLDNSNDELSDDALASILADIDPL